MWIGWFIEPDTLVELFCIANLMKDLLILKELFEHSCMKMSVLLWKSPFIVDKCAFQGPHPISHSQWSPLRWASAVGWGPWIGWGYVLVFYWCYTKKKKKSPQTWCFKFIILHSCRSKVEYTSHELKSRRHQGFIPFWRLCGRIHPSLFQFLKSPPSLAHDPLPASSKPVVYYLPFDSSLLLPSSTSKNLLDDMKPTWKIQETSSCLKVSWSAALILSASFIPFCYETVTDSRDWDEYVGGSISLPTTGHGFNYLVRSPECSWGRDI